MEKNLTRKTLNFSKGITNVPSDLLSEDTELLECDGFIYKDGEMRPIQEPKLITNIPYELKYVHKGADYKNLIAYDGKKKLYCYLYGENGIGETSEIQSFTMTGLLDVNSIGNTLVCATSSGLHYLLFKSGRYKDLGTELPMPEVDFYLKPDLFFTGSTDYVCNLDDVLEVPSHYIATYFIDTKELDDVINKGHWDEIEVTDRYQTEYWYITQNEDEDKKQTYKDAIAGHVSKQIDYSKKKGYFVHPFFVRYALKLYDGTYARISAPVICYPCTTKNNCFYPVKYDNGKWGFSPTSCRFGFSPVSSYLYYNARIKNLTDWTDIVKELVIFASDDVMPYKLDEGWTIKYPLETNKTEYWNAPYNGYGEGSFCYHWKYETLTPAMCVIVPTYKTEDEIIRELKSKSQFYKILSIKVTDASKFNGDYKADIGENVLNNLTTQEQLGKDDYYGWTSISAKKLYSYNKRLNVFDLERKPFKGFSLFMNRGLDIADYNKYGFTFYVHIFSNNMDTWVKSDTEWCGSQAFADGWFFYPDPNATEVIVWDNNNDKGMLLQLEAHPLLNGSYSFNKLPLKTTLVTDDSITKPTVDSSAKEILNSQIYTSVVNNPFVFEASGDNTVGTGKIVGIVANTEAVSQGQFGQYPLMVFTDEGVYGMSVNSEGLYSSVYPISRDVCLENSPTVPTDKLVFFASKKGLMAASGGSTACMSEILRGRVSRNFATFGEGRFLDFMKDCQIAYDYKDSMLRIFSDGKDYQYIYNMNDKTFSMVNSEMKVQAVLNDYPDNLIQDTDGNVYSLTEKPDINDDEKVYSGSFVTRPLKLGGSITLKSLRSIKHLIDTDNGAVGLEIWGSNDCKHWCQLHSMAGKPWKYFTFRYTLQGFKAVDSFAGSIVEIQNRREDKIR